MPLQLQLLSPMRVHHPTKDKLAGAQVGASGDGVSVSIAFADAIPILEPDDLTVRPMIFPASSLVG
jgi:hypothetical protein